MIGLLGHSMFVFILGLVFLTIVAPIWIVAHYISRWRKGRALSSVDEKTLGELYDAARRMEARLASLERVLDAEAPGWRTRTGS
jgi:phage shock protein B